MKLLRINLITFSILVLLPLTLHAQDLHCEKFISKSLSTVIEKYGKPVFKDESNPDMVCVFYKDKVSRKVFVTGKNGIYQSEAWGFYRTQNGALSAMDKFISECISNGFASDTVTTEYFNLAKSGVKLSIEMSFNKNTKNYELKTEAHESED